MRRFVMYALCCCSGVGTSLAHAQATADDAPNVSPDSIPIELDPNISFEHVVISADGTVINGGEGDLGGVAGPGEEAIYENILGIHTINFPSNQPVSDDVSTIAPDGCNLTRYRFKVLGNVLPGGSSGAYTVNYALYTNCPLAVGSSESARNLVKIAGTDGVVTFPDDGPRLIEHVVPGSTPVALPTNVYFGLRFNRGNCGTVIGAPAMVGFSGDIWDYPGFPCNGFLGGFPQVPHASFWLQMYGSTNCGPSFTGYKAQRPSGGAALLGADVQGVDDVRLIVNNCQMVGYEVVVRGVGLYTFDLRRNCDGMIVSGTEKTFQINASTTPQLQVARFTFDPPITLTTDSLYLGFKSNSNTGGVVITGIEPIIGESASDYFTVGIDGCAPVNPISGIHGTVNLAITCAGTLALGACCDPYLTECNGGVDLGKRCFASADCVSPGTCEAVCRQTTEINCPFPRRGENHRPTWQEGGACSPDPFLPFACGVAACCHVRPNPNTQVLEEACANLTRNQCYAVAPLDRPRLWQLGEYCGFVGQSCPRNSCLERDGSCYVPHATPGCTDPYCCSEVCSHGAAGAFCCNTAWDSACVAFAEVYCPQAPPNDQCAPEFPEPELGGALTIPVPGSMATDNRKATDNATDPGFCCNSGVGTCESGPSAGSACIVDGDCSGGTCSPRTPDPGAPGLGSIWFKFVQGSGTTAGISTCTSNSPALDSILQVYRANDSSTPLNACNSLSVIGCNDDAANCGSTQRNSRICLRNLTPGETYYILLATKTENRLGQYRVTISTSCSGGVDVVPNDYCHRSTPITDATPDDPLVVPFDLNGATFECPAASCSPTAQNDVWYDYTATCSGEATFSTCGGNNPNTNIAVYEDCTKCPTVFDNSGFLACNSDFDQSGCVEPARVELPVVQGQCYKVRIADDEGLPVSGNLTITCEFSDCQPNGTPDDLDIASCPVNDPACKDCNGNGRPDFCDIRDGMDQDCQPNQVPDTCELANNDCQPNGIPDDCDGGTGGDCPTDADGDGVLDVADNCMNVANPLQEDTDEDLIGDACDPCPSDNPDDLDQDEVCTTDDNCPLIANPDQQDGDSDGIGDPCDRCPGHADNADGDQDGVADGCDGCPADAGKTEAGICGCGVADQGDDDADGVLDCIDQCPGLDDAKFSPPCGAIPAASSWGILVMALILLVIAKTRSILADRQKRPVSGGR